MSVTPAPHTRAEEAFRHEAYLYAGQAEFLDGSLSFIRGGLAADEPILVATSTAKIEMLRSSLDGDSDGVCFVDMGELGRNPGRIISAWHEFLVERAAGGCPVRGIGEPIWAGRGSAELVEAQRHEVLLNLAFNGTAAFRLLCPYDVEALDPTVIDEAHRSHPYILERGAYRDSSTYSGAEMLGAHLDRPLPEPLAEPDELTFGLDDLVLVREAVARHATKVGLSVERTAEVVFAVNELVTNSIRYGGGQGSLLLWREGDALVCEVRDQGRIDELLVGRRLPPIDQQGGRGLWLVNQICDLVQLRSSASGTAVRLYMSCGQGADQTVPWR